MKGENTVRAKFDENGVLVQIFEDGSTKPFERQADWSYFDSLTDEDTEYNALMDPDNGPFLSDVDREKIKTLVDPKVIRKRLKLTQVEFSERFAIPLGTLRDWERRARFPDSAALAYLRVICEDPGAVAKALDRSYERVPARTNEQLGVEQPTRKARRREAAIARR